MTLRFQLKDISNVTSTKAMFERGNKVAHIQKTQHNEFVLNFFVSTALENPAIVIIVVIE
jgi:hypothetical protein